MGFTVGILVFTRYLLSASLVLFYVLRMYDLSAIIRALPILRIMYYTYAYLLCIYYVGGVEKHRVSRGITPPAV